MSQPTSQVVFKEMLNLYASLFQDTEQKKSGNYFFLDD